MAATVPLRIFFIIFFPLFYRLPPKCWVTMSYCTGWSECRESIGACPSGLTPPAKPQANCLDRRNGDRDRLRIIAGQQPDRKSTRRTQVTNAHSVCRLLLEKTTKESVVKVR